jgi:hypothetical protein
MKQDNQTPSERFWRNIRSIEDEIAHQILFAELAFEICKNIPTTPGLGSHFLPYFYNLNLSKGITSLHSLLITPYQNEISIKNYIDQYNWEYKTEVDTKFVEKYSLIADKFTNTFDLSVRNNIIAHINMSFQHRDFTNAYILPSLLNQYSDITRDLKNLFFKFTNYSTTDDPFTKLKSQAVECIKLFSN